MITLPPLRNRPEDILLLAEHFAIQMARQLQMELFAGFSEKARKTLMTYDWPGNVRELKNVVERAVYRTDPEEPVAEIILDPFESPYRPSESEPSGAAAETAAAGSDEATSAETQPATNSASNGAGYDLPLDLKQVAQELEIELINQASDWRYEAAYWAKVDVSTD